MRQELFNLLQSNDLEAARVLLSRYPPEDIAPMLRELPMEERVRALQLLPPEAAVAVSEMLGPDAPGGQAIVPEQTSDDFRQAVKHLLGERHFDMLRRMLIDMNRVDVAHLLEDSSPEERVLLFRLLPKGAAVEVFEQMDSEEQQQLLKGFTDDKTTELISGMSPDDRTRLLDEVPAGVARRLIRLLSPAQRESTLALLGYPESSAGRVMTPDFVDLRASMTVAQSLDRIQRIAPDKETVYYAYVTDAQRHLVGAASLKDLVLARREALVGEIMEPAPKSVSTYTDQEEVARILRDYDLLAVPVVDSEDRLVGIVTYDDVLDIVQEEASEDIYRYGAVPMTERAYFRANPFVRTWRRAPWLMILIGVGYVTGTLIAAQEELLVQAAILAAFIPLLIDTGGNIGAQSSTVVIRGLATGEINHGRAAKTLGSEAFVGLLLAAILGLLTFCLGMVLSEGNVQVAIVVGVTLAAIATLAALVGGGLPFLFRLVRVDPAVASAPLVTTIMDVSGVVLYFVIANALLRL